MSKKRPLPKTVVIAGEVWDVVQDPTKGGGFFSYKTYTIGVGTKDKDFFNIFCHEVLEAIFAMNGLRYHMYSDDSNDGLLFSFSHKEFEAAVRDFAFAIQGTLKQGVFP